MTQIEEIAIRARHLSALGQLEASRAQWQAALNLLPIDAPERAGVQREIDRISARLVPKPATDWKKKLGPFGVLLAALAKFKTVALLLLTKGKFLISILAFVGVYWGLFGWWIAVGLTGSVLLHEMGHYIVVRRYGFKAELPMFLPGFGAFVKWNGANVDPNIRARISLAGPLFGFFSGLIAYGIFLQTGHGVWLAVAQLAGWINLFNLIPVSLFDGAPAMSALGAQGRLAVLLVSVVLFFILHEPLLLFVVAATGYRLWRRDFPPESTQRTALYFVGLVVANGFLDWFATNQARELFGTR